VWHLLNGLKAVLLLKVFNYDIIIQLIVQILSVPFLTTINDGLHRNQSR